MKTLVRITEDFDTSIAWEMKTEDINYLVNELDVYCDISNDNYLNLVEQEKRYYSEKEDYSNSVTIEAKGYSQGDWQEYTLYYNEGDFDTLQQRAYFDSLIEHLKRTFTHQSQFNVEKIEVIIKDDKTFYSEPFDHTSLCIDYIEFPEEDDIKEAYINMFGEDYDIIEIC